MTELIQTLQIILAAIINGISFKDMMIDFANGEFCCEDIAAFLGAPQTEATYRLLRDARDGAPEATIALWNGLGLVADPEEEDEVEPEILQAPYRWQVRCDLGTAFFWEEAACRDFCDKMGYPYDRVTFGPM